ncbi:unnamed protein product, partial [Cyprideis torosa]
MTLVVEGNPAPTFRFYKGITEVLDSGRYKFITDGETNTICLCIRKSRPEDEDDYKVIVTNPHGSDEAEMHLFVSDSSGMDFRAMLKKRKYAQWERNPNDPDWGDLKEAEKEQKPMLRKVEKKQEQWMKPLIDLTVKQGKDQKAVFEGIFTKPKCKAKWFYRTDEIFPSNRYKMTDEQETYKLVILKPEVTDSGKYTVECMGISSAAYLTVEEPDPQYHFVTPLEPLTDGYTGKPIELECAVSSGKAMVHWYKGKTKLEDGPQFDISKDVMGHHKLTIKCATQEDSGEYTCKIFKQDEKTTTRLSVVDRLFKFTKMILSRKVIEKEKVILDCEVDHPEATVTWFKGEEEIMDSDKRIKAVAENRKRKLVIKEVKMGDAGIYFCKTNADTTDGELLVEYANKFKKPLSDQQVIQRERLILEVEVTDPTAPSEWFFNGELIQESERVEFKNLGGGKHQLIIKSTDMRDEGEFKVQLRDLVSTCNVRIGEGEHVPTILFEGDVEGPCEKPILINVPYKVLGHRQSNVEAKLLKDGKPLPLKEVEVKILEDRVDYKIKKPQRDLSGKYTFRLSNAQGHTDKEAGPHPEVFFRVAEGIRRGLEEWRAQLAQQATEKTADREFRASVECRRKPILYLLQQIENVRSEYELALKLQNGTRTMAQMMMGSLELHIRCLQGFARLCPGDVFEVTVRCGQEKWRSRGTILPDGRQRWDPDRCAFTKGIPVSQEPVLWVRTVELRGALGKRSITGHDGKWLAFDLLSLFRPDPKVITLALNPTGSLKLHFTSVWRPLEGLFREVPSIRPLRDANPKARHSLAVFGSSPSPSPLFGQPSSARDEGYSRSKSYCSGGSCWSNASRAAEESTGDRARESIGSTASSIEEEEEPYRKPHQSEPSVRSASEQGSPLPPFTSLDPSLLPIQPSEDFEVESHDQSLLTLIRSQVSDLRSSRGHQSLVQSLEDLLGTIEDLLVLRQPCSATCAASQQKESDEASQAEGEGVVGRAFAFLEPSPAHVLDLQAMDGGTPEEDVLEPLCIGQIGPLLSAKGVHGERQTEREIKALRNLLGGLEGAGGLWEGLFDGELVVTASEFRSRFSRWLLDQRSSEEEEAANRGLCLSSGDPERARAFVESLSKNGDEIDCPLLSLPLEDTFMIQLLLREASDSLHWIRTMDEQKVLFWLASAFLSPGAARGEVVDVMDRCFSGRAVLIPLLRDMAASEADATERERILQLMGGAYGESGREAARQSRAEAAGVFPGSSALEWSVGCVVALVLLVILVRLLFPRQEDYSVHARDLAGKGHLWSDQALVTQLGHSVRQGGLLIPSAPSLLLLPSPVGLIRCLIRSAPSLLLLPSPIRLIRCLIRRTPSLLLLPSPIRLIRCLIRRTPSLLLLPSPVRLIRCLIRSAPSLLDRHWSLRGSVALGSKGEGEVPDLGGSHGVVIRDLQRVLREKEKL